MRNFWLKYSVIVLFLLKSVISVAQGTDCQWEKFKNDTDHNTAKGKALTEAIDENPDLIDAWEKADQLGIDDAIRKNPEYLKTIDQFRFGETSKATILRDATDKDWQQILSGKLVDVTDDKPDVSLALKDKFGANTKTSKKYDTDPTGKEFDGITDKYFIEHKELTTTGSMSAGKRAQMKYQMKACKTMKKDNYLIFEGVRNDNWINNAVRYANEFKVNTKIELNGVILHDLKF